MSLAGNTPRAYEIHSAVGRGAPACRSRGPSNVTVEILFRLRGALLAAGGPHHAVIAFLGSRRKHGVTYRA